MVDHNARRRSSEPRNFTKLRLSRFLMEELRLYEEYLRHVRTKNNKSSGPSAKPKKIADALVLAELLREAIDHRVRSASGSRRQYWIEWWTRVDLLCKSMGRNKLKKQATKSHEPLAAGRKSDVAVRLSPEDRSRGRGLL